ncbi:TOMM precursor leader peptide-binding protein [Metabacillus sp. RGM 3146]|uniref:TOMM precursor leader peptide-binding protein n=1 Tax=Metabacillus sp. RGM 3146 TaxID=3401092 RepID=UPI003B9D9BA7
MKSIAVIGSGSLADLAREKLASRFSLVKEAGDADAALLLQDNWNPSYYQSMLKELAGIPVLNSHLSYGEGVIGPLTVPEKQGCAQCAETRKLMAGRDRIQMQILSETPTKEADPWAGRTGMLQMIHIMEAELDKLSSGEKAVSNGSVMLLNLRTLNASWHTFLPDPFCAVCGSLPDDSPEAAVISLQSSRKISKNSYRCRSMDELSKVLAKDYLDHRTGLFNAKMLDLSTPFADVSVNLPLFGGDEGTAGRTNSYKISEMTAILEGLERYCGLSPRGKKTVVHGSYSSLKEKALNPLAVGVHAAEQYEKPDFPFQPFDPDRKMKWVWGYSFMKKEPILVPELLAYYSLGCGHRGGYVYETSNGCAVGGSLEEAIFHGIMEVVERDSFLMTWYAKLPLQRLDPRSADDTELNLMLDRLNAAAGYDLYLYQSTMEHGIPSIWTLMKNTRDKGLHLTCAAGAHLDPVKAVKGAVFELAGMLGMQEARLEANKEKCLEMLDDSSLVRGMEDHGLLYGLPEAEERLSFLLDDSRPFQTFEEAFSKTPYRTDIKEDLEDILHRFKKLNLDVITVDQTAPELRKNGLYCVKVLIPGMLPMTFGHHLTRVTNLERVLKVPAALGYRKEPLSLEELNPYPHPFP